MKHIGTKVIETERLILRPFKEGDEVAMFKNWASDSEVTKYLSWETHSSLEVSKMVLGFWISDYNKLDNYQWAITLKDNDEPIGSIGVVKKIEENVGNAEIGYCIGRAFWHQGITSEALKGLIDFLFDCVGVNKVSSRYDTRNTNSGLVMKKCGMKYEGTLRASECFNQGLCDVNYYGILRSER